MTKNCEICGAVITVRSDREKYCSKTCADKAKCRNNKKPPKEALSNAKPALSIAEIAKLARAAGMTYGQYVAMRKGVTNESKVG